MNHWWLQSEIDGVRSQVGRLRDDLQRSRREAAGPIPHRPGMVRLGLVMMLVFFEALALALGTWGYTGSHKGLTVPMPDGSVLGGLHWDPVLAILASVAVFFVWAVVIFMIPIVGPLAGLAVSALWGGVAFGFSESIGLGVLVFLFSFIGRTGYRAHRGKTMAVVEGVAVVALAVFALAPFGADARAPGLGGWHFLREIRDRHQCAGELEKAHYDRLCTVIKARDRGRCEQDLRSGATFFNRDHQHVNAAVKACAKNKAQARNRG